MTVSLCEVSKYGFSNLLGADDVFALRDKLFFTQPIIAPSRKMPMGACASYDIIQKDVEHI